LLGLKADASTLSIVLSKSGAKTCNTTVVTQQRSRQGTSSQKAAACVLFVGRWA
jgi:hypothetical protein